MAKAKSKKTKSSVKKTKTKAKAAKAAKPAVKSSVVKSVQPQVISTPIIQKQETKESAKVETKIEPKVEIKAESHEHHSTLHAAHTLHHNRKTKSLPLSGGFMVVSIVGLIASALYTNSGALDTTWGVTFIVFCSIVFLASVISITPKGDDLITPSDKVQ